jgi:hypothetical protein
LFYLKSCLCKKLFRVVQGKEWKKKSSPAPVLAFRSLRVYFFPSSMYCCQNQRGFFDEVIMTYSRPRIYVMKQAPLFLGYGIRKAMINVSRRVNTEKTPFTKDTKNMQIKLHYSFTWVE